MPRRDVPGALASRAEAVDVLRYWLHALRYEEALASRPRARRPDPRAAPPDLLEPGAGQSYLRFGTEHAELALRASGPRAMALDDGGLRFLERAVREEYRREQAEARGQPAEARGARFLLGWPTLHFTRREELATLLRFPVTLEWRRGGKPWRPPTLAERRLGRAPELPDALLVTPAEVDGDAGELPLSVDLGLLQHTLGVTEEELAELTRGWKRGDATAASMARDLAGALAPGSPLPALDEPAALFASLAAAVRARAQPGVDAYAAGLVTDGALLHATYHLQRELAALIDLDDEEPPLVPGTALWAYLTGDLAEEGRRPLLARRAPRGLTPSQREAAEVALGSTLAAVQGPPGTGKTELILALAGHAVVERAARFATHQRMTGGLLVVASTNNRAVDNVIDPLCPGTGDRLPVALRAGSQEVTATATVATLARVIAWISARPAADAERHLRAATERFSAAHRALEAALARGEAEAEAHLAHEASLELRERWAVARREALLPALRSAQQALEDHRSLRRVLAQGREVRTWLLGLFPVVGATLLSLGNVLDDEAESVDRLVIDEAGQCHPAFAVTGLLRARQALLIGDVQQLPPVLSLLPPDEQRVRREAKLRLAGERLAPFQVHAESGASAQALADRAVTAPARLTDHFRCQPEIIDICTRLSGYALSVHTPPRSHAARVPALLAPVRVLDVPGAQLRARGSWCNLAELEAALDLVEHCLAHGLEPGDLAVLTPYVGQLDRLRAALRRRGLPVEAGEELEAPRPASGLDRGIGAGTIHRFQGGERSVVVLSTVVTEARSLRFLDERPHLLNVAVSRARDHLVVIGDTRTLAAGQRTRALLDAARAAHSKR